MQHVAHVCTRTTISYVLFVLMYATSEIPKDKTPKALPAYYHEIFSI